MSIETWQPGDPLYARWGGGGSVGYVRRAVQVIDDLAKCRDGTCALCLGRDVSNRPDTDAMTVKFGGTP